MKAHVEADPKVWREIVLADDDSDDREIFKEATDSVYPDLNLVLAKDGGELMELLKSKKTSPDLIFLDLNMPRMNGKECLSEMKRDEELKDIPVVIYTTSINPVDVDFTFNHGAHYFFRKPNSIKEIEKFLHIIFYSGILKEKATEREKFVLNNALRKPGHE